MLSEQNGPVPSYLYYSNLGSAAGHYARRPSKRVPGSEFLGKRVPGSEFLGKRAPGSEFLGKRAPGSEFLGKRSLAYDNDDEQEEIEFVKRAPEMYSAISQSDRDNYFKNLRAGSLSGLTRK